MSSRVRFVAIVCIAVFAFTAVAAMPMLATLDAQVPLDPRLHPLPPAVAPSAEDRTLPTAPAAEVPSPRAPPRS